MNIVHTIICFSMHLHGFFDLVCGVYYSTCETNVILLILYNVFHCKSNGTINNLLYFLMGSLICVCIRH